jgi:host factor-I protein
MSAEKPNAQDVYLNEARKAKKPIRVLMCNGKELRGIVTSFDSFTLLLEAKGMELLVYKSAIAVIAPEQAEG